MTGQYIVQALFALAGITSLLAALFNWDWFFTARNAQNVVRYMGRRQARLFYGILGIILIGMAVFFFIETQKALGAALQ
ncbi:immunity 17 family protein [uncultured Bacteroides sp.]|jgi:small neutral amino acid transporter SnatA (MarC family)|uniref:immunity 17 family protein n=1 Tax=uncultured Bacteroides sp. TaxID=162156 RepID=UPI0025EF7C95|nr:immunity 17 family protein [uncultured Bacteroides sp.]